MLRTAIVTLALLGLGGATMAHLTAKEAMAKPTLKFSKSKQFKIVQFSDIQDDEVLDPRTIAAIGKIIDSEKPDLVVLTGDNISAGECETKDKIMQAIDEVAKPIEARKVPWAMVFGNHDTDGIAEKGVTKQMMLEQYRSKPHNINPKDDPSIYGVGDGLLTIAGSDSNKPAFGVWLIDSNAYAPGTIGGEKLDSYDWIHQDQIAWYANTSKAMEKDLGHKLPSLMYFHIGLPELAALAASGKIEGENNEPVCPAQVNSGMFVALMERGDVLGVYVGHDHANTYQGSKFGITLGYGGSVGYNAYGIESKDEKVRNRIRGGRVFILDENNLKTFKTYYVYADKVK